VVYDLEELKWYRTNLMLLETRRDRLVTAGEDTTSIEAIIRSYRNELLALEGK
jgi:hypothetical protein